MPVGAWHLHGWWWLPGQGLGTALGRLGWHWRVMPREAASSVLVQILPPPARSASGWRPPSLGCSNRERCDVLSVCLSGHGFLPALLTGLLPQLQAHTCHRCSRCSKHRAGPG